jgi:hypothetical protein
VPKIKVRGVKSYRSKRRIHHYHRATGIRVDIDLNAEPEQFLARVRELDMKGQPLLLGFLSLFVLSLFAMKR